MKTVFFFLMAAFVFGCSKTQVSPVPVFSVDSYVGVWENDKYAGITYTISKLSDTEAKIIYRHNLDGNGSNWKTQTFTGTFSPKGQYQVYDELQFNDPTFTSMSYLTIYYGENKTVTIKSGNLDGVFFKK